MPRLRVHGGDHPVLGDPARDAEHPVRRRGRGPGRPRWPATGRPGPTLGGQLAPVQRRQQRRRVAGQRIHQRLARGRDRRSRTPVCPPRRSRRRGTAAPAARPPDSASAAFSSPRIAERTSVTVSIVATASYSGVESSTRLRPTSPAAFAASSVTSKIRFGRSERGQPGPHVHQHRVHEPRIVEIQPTRGVLPPRVEREPLHRLPIRQPSIRCSTITTATIIGGTLRRPTSVNKSANISSGNKSKHSRCNTP